MKSSVIAGVLLGPQPTDLGHGNGALPTTHQGSGHRSDPTDWRIACASARTKTATAQRELRIFRTRRSEVRGRERPSALKTI